MHAKTKFPTGTQRLQNVLSDSGWCCSWNAYHRQTFPLPAIVLGALCIQINVDIKNVKRTWGTGWRAWSVGEKDGGAARNGRRVWKLVAQLQ